MAAKTENRYIRYYTVGSAARKLNPQVIDLPQITPKVRKVSRIRYLVDPVTAFAVGTAVFMSVCLTVGLVQFSQVRAEQQTMSRYVLQLTAANAELTREFEANLDLEKIETKAKNLGMIPADQVEHIHVALPAD